MSKNFKFWAVVDIDGVCDVRNEQHQNLKAIFSNKDDARKVIAKNPSIPIWIEPVYITAAAPEE
ncbi:hypothetical protein [Erwinia rhapontici]|uniref:hypothetical protein n=1 Tax=Erwinia rhapontici TaxID=55212 RepID=UPI0013317BB1|nr:hypothetical protein [Erwinia rhapontici]MBP2156891.1 hypothetical protein [Erwinia rhapontici]